MFTTTPLVYLFMNGFFNMMINLSIVCLGGINFQNSSGVNKLSLNVKFSISQRAQAYMLNDCSQSYLNIEFVVYSLVNPCFSKFCCLSLFNSVKSSADLILVNRLIDSKKLILMIGAMINPNQKLFGVENLGFAYESVMSERMESQKSNTKVICFSIPTILYTNNWLKIELTSSASEK